MNLESINWVDVVLGGTVLISALIGIARGLIKEVLSLLAWVIAIWVAWKFADMVADKYIRGLIDDPTISYLAAFGGLFLVTLFVLGLFNMLVSSFLASSGLGGIDRMLGMIFGLLRGVLIAASMVFIGKFIPPVGDSKVWQESKLRPTFDELAEWGISKLPPDIRLMLKKENMDAAVGVIGNTLVVVDPAPANAQQATRPQTSEQAQADQRQQTQNIANMGNPQGGNNPQGIIILESETSAPANGNANGNAAGITLESTQGQ